LFKNHPFNDGNKRTGALATLLFLELNGIKIPFHDEIYEEFIIRVAKGEANKSQIAFFLKHGVERIPSIPKILPLSASEI